MRDAVPFGLKTMEGLLEEKPRHEGLLTALASGFTQYAYAFVQADADLADLRRPARRGPRRARARPEAVPARARLRAARARRAARGDRRRGCAPAATSREALAAARKEDVPLLYWTASAWALAVSNGKGDMALVAELPIPVAMMERAARASTRRGTRARSTSSS